MTVPFFQEPEDQELKPTFQDIPEKLLDQISKRLKSDVQTGQIAYGGLSASASFTMDLKNKTRLFVKGSHPGDDSHATENLRQEVYVYRNIKTLDKFSPRFLGVFSDGNEDGWSLGVWKAVPVSTGKFQLDKMLQHFAFWQRDPAAERVLKPAKEHVYIGQFLNGDKKWKRIKEEPEVQEKFLSLFEDQDAAKSWLSKNIDKLISLQSFVLNFPFKEGLLHGDLRKDNILFALDGEIYTIDWPNACFGPLLFDVLFLFSNLIGLGLATEEELFSVYEAQGGLSFLKEEKIVMLTALSGYFATQAYRDIPEKLPRLRWMQKTMLLAQLQMLANAEAIDLPPKMVGQQV